MQEGEVWKGTGSGKEEEGKERREKETRKRKGGRNKLALSLLGDRRPCAQKSNLTVVTSLLQRITKQNWGIFAENSYTSTWL